MFGSTKENAADGFSRLILSRGTCTIPNVFIGDTPRIVGRHGLA